MITPQPSAPSSSTSQLGAEANSAASLFSQQSPTILLRKTDAEYIRLIDEARERSRHSRLQRREKNAKNWDFYNLKQDWSHKQEGQSRHFLPDLPIAVEQVAASIERNLVGRGRWFGVETNPDVSLLDADTIRLLMEDVLARVWAPGNSAECTHFATILGDAVKMGIIEAIITLKVYGRDEERPIYRLERSTVQVPDPSGLLGADGSPITYERMGLAVAQAIVRSFRLAIDIVPYEDHFPDQSPAYLYDIHEVTRHISELAENPDYDSEAIQRVRGRLTQLEEMRFKQARSGQIVDTRTVDEVRVREYWGDIVDSDTGEIIERNVLCTTCYGEMLRPPSPNPFWHGRRPFVTAPILRTPLSTNHKAFLDLAVPAATAQNELFSLMTDGAIASVWGVRQVRPDLLENPAILSKGIPPAFTAILREGVPANDKFMERVDDPTMPQYADLMLKRTQDAQQLALATNDIRMGSLPPRQVKATEVVEAQEASTSLWDCLSGHIERTIATPVLELAWLTLWQFVDDFTEPDLVRVLGPTRALQLSQFPPEQRFVMLANGVRFKVMGLTAMQESVKDFQRLTTAIQMASGNPLLWQVFIQRFDPAKLMERLVRNIGIDPTTIEYTPEQLKQMAMMQLAEGGMFGPPQLAGNPSMPQGGGSPVPGAAPAPGGLGVTSPEVSSVEQSMAPPNPFGNRGPQM